MESFIRYLQVTHICSFAVKLNALLEKKIKPEGLIKHEYSRLQKKYVLWEEKGGEVGVFQVFRQLDI